MVFSDGDGVLKWVERDGSTAVRQFNINDLCRRSEDQGQSMSNPLNETVEHGWGDIVQKIIPTKKADTDTALGQNSLALWTGDGKLGLLGFGREVRSWSAHGTEAFSESIECRVHDWPAQIRAIRSLGISETKIKIGARVSPHGSPHDRRRPSAG